MRAEKRIFRKRQELVDTRKLWGILYPVLAASLFLAGCGQAVDDDGTDILPERVQGDSAGQGESGKMADSGAEPEEDNVGSGGLSAEYAAEGATKPDSGENMDSIAVICPDGKEIEWAVYSEGVYCYSSVTDFWSGTGLYGYLSEDGTVEMPFSYDGISLFSDGSIALRTGETWELKDREGSVIFAGECGFISEQGDGYAISTDGKTSFYDRQGREVVSDRDGYDLNMNRNRVFGAENSYVLSSGILLKTGKENGSDREEELLVNQITPQAGAFAELMKNGSITTDTTGPEHTTDAEMLRQCKRFGKLYRTEEEGETMLYFYAKPWVQPMFSESYSGFFVAKNGQAEQKITASECGGSMKGDRICFWYDAEKEALKPGTVGSYGGFDGMAYGGEIYRLGRGKAVLENSYMYSSEISADGEVKETYFVNDKAVSEEAYLAVENRYREYTPIGR